jgi:antitoxin HicB
MLAHRYTVSDGKLVLFLEPAEEGGYVITSPSDVQLNTQAETFEEVFPNAYDAREVLERTRLDLAREFAETGMIRERPTESTGEDPPPSSSHPKPDVPPPAGNAPGEESLRRPELGFPLIEEPEEEGDA